MQYTPQRTDEEKRDKLFDDVEEIRYHLKILTGIVGGVSILGVIYFIAKYALFVLASNH